MNGFASADAQWLSLAVALGVGLLIGLEREQGKRRGRNRDRAGIRTFAVASLTGALAHALGNPALVIAGALLVGVLAAAMHWRTHTRDAGFTTELSLFITYLVVLMVLSMALGTLFGVLGQPFAQFGDALLMSLLNAAWLTVVLAVLAALHEQFAEPSPAALGQTFE